MVARLKPGGRLVIADLVPHDDESMREVMGDLRLGLSPQAVGESSAVTTRHRHSATANLAGGLMRK